MDDLRGWPPVKNNFPRRVTSRSGWTKKWMSLPNITATDTNQKQTTEKTTAMKTNRNIITSIATAAIALIASAASSHAANRTLILLQENSNGKSYLDGVLSGAAQFAADSLIDSLVEGGEALKFESLANGRYQNFINLSDLNCTRAKLLDSLIAESRAGRTVDLAVLGHGADNLLGLHDGEVLTGLTSKFVRGADGIFRRQTDEGSLRRLLADARTREGSSFNFKLRLVHMCNCFGGTLNDDWLAIGAKVSVGAPRMDWMPEPMNTFFWDDFVKNDKTVAKAAADSLAATRPLWFFMPTYQDENPVLGLNKLDETQQSVSGDRNLIFRDEFRMSLNQSRTFNIRAVDPNTFVRVFVEPNQRYSFTTDGSKWNDGGFLSPDVTAAGHSSNIFGPRRYPFFNAMSLVGERFNRPDGNPFNFVLNSGFKIGTSHSRTFSSTGFLNLFANDNLFPDNRGSVKVTVKRIQ